MKSISKIKIKNLKQLAELFIDKKIFGNKDQIIVNFITNKYKGKDFTEHEIQKKYFSAMRNFDSLRQKILRDRIRSET